MISIIIPVLNEAERIGPLLEHLSKTATAQNISDIIVVDGGSSDGTQNIVSDFSSSTHTPYKEKSRIAITQQGNQTIKTLVHKPKFLETIFSQTDVEVIPNTKVDSETHSGLAIPSKVILLNSPKGRAKQMNLGAKHAKGNIYYFLHADALPPMHFDSLIINEIKQGNDAGCFRMQFNSRHWWLRLASWLTQFSWRACRGGDQSQFITKALFDEIGGYDETYTIYEDNILINELYRRKEFVVINKKIRTSARLYKKVGIWKLQYHFWAIYVKRWLGASADEMLAYYKKNIS